MENTIISAIPEILKCVEIKICHAIFSLENDALSSLIKDTLVRLH